MKTKRGRLGAALLALCLTVGLVPAAWGAEAAAARDTIEIATPHDLVGLAEKCALDAWSQGKTVVLTADLDLTGVPFGAIPSFRGTFRGSGHTISGLLLTGKGSRVGLFRVVEQGGVVEDLTVEGVASPEGSRSSVGLLCGENYGTLRDCFARGTVSGKTDVGGLVGFNAGALEGCGAEAVVTGTENTGGVCGRNTGSLTGCSGAGEVNAATVSESLTDPILNTGGVVGRSDGVLSACVSTAAVGYPHIGYNVGGVAGLHAGALSDCANRGEVQGRKAVGGVVGRFAPETDLIYGQDPVKALNAALSGLSGLLTTLSGQLSDTVGAGVDDLEAISHELDALRSTATAGREQGSADARAALDAVYERTQSINTAAGAVNGALSGFSDQAGAHLDALVDQADALEDALGKLADAVDDGMGESLDQLERYTRDIKGDISDIRGAIDGLAADMKKIDTFLATAADILRGEAPAVRGAQDERDITDAILGGYQEILARVEDALDKLDRLGKAAQSLKGIDLSYRLKQMGAGLDEVGRDLAGLTSAVNRAYDSASADAQAARKDLDRAGDKLSAELKAFNSDFQTMSDRVSGQCETINGDLDAIQDTLKTWADQIDAVGTGTMDGVDGHLDAISARIDKVTQGARGSNDSIHVTTDALIRQLDTVRLAANGLTQAPERTVDDRSDETGGADGLILSARNQGPVAGDANVGGVVGIVAFQSSDDPEEELDWPDSAGGLLSDITAVVRASVRNCENAGTVTAKNECAGGIVGRADMGAVLDCGNTGDVTVTGGACCGGVVGQSKSAVRRSWALCALTGQDRVGGIAGEGKDLSDCRAMVTVDAGGECLGAIAGWADGELTDNFTVAEGLGAVDGIDLAGKAQGLPYSEFAALPGLPEDFLHFALTFAAEGRTIRTIPFAYGGSVDAGEVPEVPRKAGHYGSWESFSTAGLRRSRTIQAVYTPWETTISSGGSRPDLLAQGSFSPAAAIALSDWAPDEIPGGRTLAASWAYAITDPEAGSPLGTLRVRVLAEGRKAEVLLWDADGRAVAVDAQRDGSYLVFDAPASGRVAVVTANGVPVPVLLAGGGAVLVLLAAVVFAKKRRKKAKAQPPAAV